MHLLQIAKMHAKSQTILLCFVSVNGFQNGGHFLVNQPAAAASRKFSGEANQDAIDTK